MSAKESSLKIWAAGFAMFAMFFGSGNLVFPIFLGTQVQSQTWIATLGLMITAVVVPFSGVLCMILYRGDYQQYFRLLGKIPSLLVCTSIIALIGPFGVLPRCLTIAHATVKMYSPGFPLVLFSGLACALIFVGTMKKGRLISLLGYLLTPVLLLTLVIIIIKGFFQSTPPLKNTYTPLNAFGRGILEGYNTMDLLATFFFSKAVLSYFQRDEYPISPAYIVKSSLKSGIIGMGLLAMVYVSFCFLGASFTPFLKDVPPEQMLMTIAFNVLGPIGGILASIAIALACLTTAMALAEVSARFLSQQLTNDKLKPAYSMLIVLGISLGVSTFEFSGIARFLVPIVKICYPFLIILTMINLFLKFVPVRLFRKKEEWS